MIRSLISWLRGEGTIRPENAQQQQDAVDLEAAIEDPDADAVPERSDSSMLTFSLGAGLLLVVLAIPIIAQSRVESPSAYKESFKAPLAHDAVVASFGLSACLVVEAALDFCYASERLVDFCVLRFASVFCLLGLNLEYLLASDINARSPVYWATANEMFVLVQAILALAVLQKLDTAACWTTDRCLGMLFALCGVGILNILEIYLGAMLLMLALIVGFVVLALFWHKQSMVSPYAWSLPADDFYCATVIRILVLAGVLAVVTGGAFQDDYVGRSVASTVLRSLFCFAVCAPARLQFHASIREEGLAAVDRIERVLEVKRNFVRYVGHEIRTPLNILLLGLDHIEAKLRAVRRLPNDTFDHILELSLSCHSAVHILDDLLSYEKIESGILTLEKTRVQLYAFLHKSLRSLRVFAAQNEKNMIISYGPFIEELRVSEVTIDKSKITQVLRNLSSNAIKFSRRGGGVEVRVSIQAREGQNRLLVEFVDSGVGISSENIGRLFGNGVQFDAAENQGGGGSGMGLWICKQIMAMHEGEIGCVSAGLGHGSTFFIELPIEPDRSLSEERQSSERQSIIRTATSDTYIGKSNSDDEVLDFLIVDDSIPNLKMLRNVIKLIGHRCAQASDGVEAVDTCMRGPEPGKPFDVVLMDYQMPNLDGPAACRVMRQQGFRGEIIGVTGMVSDAVNAEFINHGANKVLIKPLTADQLFDAVADLLDARRSSNQVISLSHG